MAVGRLAGRPGEARRQPRLSPVSASAAADERRRVLDQLSTGVAIFNADKKLAFYNAAYRSLWDLDGGFLGLR